MHRRFNHQPPFDNLHFSREYLQFQIESVCIPLNTKLVELSIEQHAYLCLLACITALMYISPVMRNYGGQLIEQIIIIETVGHWSCVCIYAYSVFTNGTLN